MSDTRFAYIDSQGNEVPIPSVDALALRIELGAIGPDTELYDAQADRWGPAHTHEIFHTLSRDAEDEGFVAPPPPVKGPAEEEEASGSDEEPADEGEEADDADEGEEPEEAGEEDSSDDDLGLDLAGDLALVDEDEEGGPEAESEEPAAEEESGMDFGLTDAPDAEEETVEADAGAGEADEGGFDFGDVGALELEESEEEEEEPLPEPPQERPSDAGDGGLELEQPLSEMGGDDDAAGGSGGLELEQPMSEFDADSPPAWMEQDGPEQDDDAMDFAPGVDDEEDEDEAPQPTPATAADTQEEEEEEERPEKREPRSRPSPPRRPKKTSPVKIVVGLVVVAGVGAGGWFGWQAMQGGGAVEEEVPETPVLPAVTIPDIPAELLPQMRDLGEQALADMIEELRAMQSEFELLEEPRQDWLAGIYLANASEYPEVQQYWVALENYVDQIREVDTQVFHENYLEQLEAAEIAADTADILLERADSGFLATRNDRFEAYNQMDDLINASLDLHDFLLRNEAQIEYEPAAGGVSRDPVLEAVPANDEIGDQMWDMVDRITSALDALGTLDRVTTERLLAVLFDRIRRAGFE